MSRTSCQAHALAVMGANEWKSAAELGLAFSTLEALERRGRVERLEIKSEFPSNSEFDSYSTRARLRRRLIKWRLK